MFFCAISGEPPQDPVISTKSGHVYERRLVQKYITENGTDPVTGEKLEESDLVSVKASAYFYPVTGHAACSERASSPPPPL
jgi:pre-mRNA-processing factor 19